MSGDFLQAAFKKYQTIILPIAAVLVALLIFITIVIPQGMKIPETNTQIKTAQSELQALNKKESLLESIDANKFKDDIDTSMLALPPDPDISGVFNQIALALTANSLPLNDINISQAQAKNSADLSDYVLKIGSVGTGDNLNGFIEQSKQIPRVVKVQAFDTSSGGPITTLANSTTAQGLQIEITIQTFYKPVPASQNLNIDSALVLPTDADQKLLSKIRDEVSALPAAASSSANLPSGKPDPFQ